MLEAYWIQLTANYWSHFGSLCQLMRVNMSNILLYDLLVFKGAHPSITKTSWYTNRYTQASFLEGKPCLRAATSKGHSRVTRGNLTGLRGSFYFHQPTVYDPAECVVSTVLIRGNTDDHMVKVKVKVSAIW